VSSLAGGRFTGRSLVADPLGYTIIDLGPDPGYAEVELDLDRLSRVRELLPLLDLRRPELYKGLVV